LGLTVFTLSGPVNRSSVRSTVRFPVTEVSKPEVSGFSGGSENETGSGYRYRFPGNVFTFNPGTVGKPREPVPFNLG